MSFSALLTHIFKSIITCIILVDWQKIQSIHHLSFKTFVVIWLSLSVKINGYVTLNFEFFPFWSTNNIYNIMFSKWIWIKIMMFNLICYWLFVSLGWKVDMIMMGYDTLKMTDAILSLLLCKTVCCKCMCYILLWQDIHESDHGRLWIASRGDSFWEM